MPYPMLNKKTVENIEKTVRLPIGVIRGLDLVHLSFYLKNRNEMKIEQDENGRFLYSFGGKKFTEDEFDKYLDRIDFRGPEIDLEYRVDGIPVSRFLTSEQINEQLDKTLD